MSRNLEELQEKFGGAAQTTFRQLSLDDEKIDIERDGYQTLGFRRFARRNDFFTERTQTHRLSGTGR